MSTTSVKQALATSLRSAARCCVKAVPLSLIFIGVMASSCRSTKMSSGTRAESESEAALSSAEMSHRSDSSAISASLTLEDICLELNAADTSALRFLLGLPAAAADSSLMSPPHSDTCGTPPPLPLSSRGASPHGGFSLRLTAARASIGSSGTSVSRQCAATRSDSSSAERASAASSAEKRTAQRSPVPLLCALLAAAVLVFLCRRR